MIGQEEGRLRPRLQWAWGVHKAWHLLFSFKFFIRKDCKKNPYINPGIDVKRTRVWKWSIHHLWQQTIFSLDRLQSKTGFLRQLVFKAIFLPLVNEMSVFIGKLRFRLQFQLILRGHSETGVRFQPISPQSQIIKLVFSHWSVQQLYLLQPYKSFSGRIESAFVKPTI